MDLELMKSMAQAILEDDTAAAAALYDLINETKDDVHFVAPSHYWLCVDNGDRYENRTFFITVPKTLDVETAAEFVRRSRNLYSGDQVISVVYVMNTLTDIDETLLTERIALCLPSVSRDWESSLPNRRHITLEMVQWVCDNLPTDNSSRTLNLRTRIVVALEMMQKHKCFLCGSAVVPSQLGTGCEKKRYYHLDCARDRYTKAKQGSKDKELYGKLWRRGK